MSASLLLKSLKLTEDNKGSKKKNLRKKRIQSCKWRRIIRNLNEIKEKETTESILENIRKFEELDNQIAVNIPEKIFSGKFNINNSDSINFKSEEEEKTVFTEKDFEEFEKEYFAS